MLELSSTGQQKYTLSVIIATLGGESLVGTIEQLNRGTLVPSEILVCIPEEDAFRVKGLSIPNVMVVKTKVRGQVAQRATGFQHAQHPIVMQLDDDVIVKENTLQELTDALTMMGSGNAVAPLYFDVLAKHFCHEVRDGFFGWLNNAFTYLVCAAPWGIKRMGVLTVIGINYGVDSRHCGSKPFETQWLPGACVICFREDLIMDNFFPYTGKAFCEDVIHSWLRNKKGILQWIIPASQCFIDAPIPDNSIKSISAENQARRYLLKLSGGPAWRLLIYETLKWVKRALTRCP